MSDAAFDILAAHFDYNAVGHKVTGGLPHYERMYSLDNVFNIEDSPLDLMQCVDTPKLDGAAISALYIDGLFSLGLTRGDGIIGQDITEKVRLLVPNQINQNGIVQITGEVMVPKAYPNPRNLAAGSLNLKDMEKFAKRPLVFVAYGHSATPHTFWTDDMRALKEEGFNTVLDFPTGNYPTDGKVYRINNNDIFEAYGYTSKYPRGAFALKEIKEGVHTILKDVIWQVGKSGVVSPVAILETIEIGGAKVSRATLHNIEYINDLDLEEGCTVEVIRSGEIIPRVVRRVN